ncbi:MAG: hypothetical protein GWN09_07390, partial [Gammaproteobacteria bacterium]|nr:hypothetical protein [Gammaproteobacteria bacterium]NIW86410.1 hypothetical protein [Gammaproteobacteria bacterium]
PVSLQPDSSDEAPLLLVMGGGGGDAYPMAKTVLNALPKIRAHMKVRCVVLTGPNMAPDQH